jgi:hypothetical protein
MKDVDSDYVLTMMPGVEGEERESRDEERRGSIPQSLEPTSAYVLYC